MDYSSLRAAAMQHGEDEEAVTVDTRALIDKVLARYAGEWTTLRELIQNAADAQATSVTITWETLPSTQVPIPNTTDRSELLKHVLSNHTLRRLVVQNDGQPFTKTDWGRLKRIAEGNPDETKIGAFGVGFYSVFADCEEPFVSSGSEAMAFYWKGNSLFTRKSQLPEAQTTKYTTFILDYRNTTTPLPNLLSVGQFLATSLTFVALQNITFKIDDYEILSLKKKTSPPAQMSLPRDLEPRTKEGFMRVVSVERTSTQIDASFMSAVGWRPQAATSTKSADSYGSSESSSLKSFFARFSNNSASNAKAKQAAQDNLAQKTISENVTKANTSTIFLRATSASIETYVGPSFAAELQRATKKPPPKTTKLAILTSSYDEAHATESAAIQGAVGTAVDVFASVLPNKRPGGRVFIGFPTMQTTGGGLHVSAPSVIPTVEREAIDLNARWVKGWNEELLRAAGIITRLAFVHEMADLDRRLKECADKNKRISDAAIQRFMPEAIHIFKTFTFADSTPSSQVGKIIEEAFWTCFKNASIEMYSSRGVLPTSAVRLGIEQLAAFIDTVPVVPNELMELTFVKKLIDFDVLSYVMVADVKKELEAKALTKSQATSFITWLGKTIVAGEIDDASRAALLDVAVATSSDDDSGEIIALGNIRYCLNGSRVPHSNMPLPPRTVPYDFTLHCSPEELRMLRWGPLEMPTWLRHLLETAGSRSVEESLTRSPQFSVQVLTFLSKSWDSLPAQDRTSIVGMLQNQAIMPTKSGMKLPNESFLPSVKLFDDLPTLQGCERLKEKFLVAIGVRKMVDLETIFARLLNPAAAGGQAKWSHQELIKYLASMQDDIANEDVAKLENTKFCPAEAGPRGMEPTKGSDHMYKISELFEPKAELRKLNLPILQWPGPPGSFRPNGPEAKFLKSLGLRSFPSVQELVEMMASKDATLRADAMSYFIGNHHLNSYSSFNLLATKRPILPVEGSSDLVTPSECFTNPNASILGFKILRRDLQDHATKFRVVRDPPLAECVSRLLARPPTDQQAAVALFSYFSSRSSELGENYLVQLRNARIVPIFRTAAGKTRASATYISPSHTYLGSSERYGAIFDFVDFGQNANAFLFRCGAKHEPSEVEVALLACTEPARLLTAMGGDERYIDLLKSLAEKSTILQRDRELWKKMKTAPFLLSYHEAATPNSKLIDIYDDEAPMRQCILKPASDIVVIDDVISQGLFKEHLYTAPEDETLELFYQQLGVRTLSSIVQEHIRFGGRVLGSKKSESLRKHILERSKIFLHEWSNSRRDAVKHDTKWLEKNLTIQMVQSISLTRTLRGHRKSHTEDRSAAGDTENGKWSLYIVDNGNINMYHVSMAVCQALLNRPNQQAYFFFEPFLTLDLYGLRARGYNVDRILRVKAAQAKIAEEARLKALEEERKRIAEQEQEWAAQEQIHEPRAAEAARQVATTPETKTTMPGSWSSPDDPPVDPNPFKKGKGLFSSLTRRLGLDNDEHSEAKQQMDKFLGNQPAMTPQPAPSGGQTMSTGNDEGRVTNPAMVQQNLLNAIGSTRAHGSNSVFSEPRVNEVKEQATYCDKMPAHNIILVASASNGMKVYVTKDLGDSSSAFLAANRAEINSFAALLTEVAQIYSLSPSVLHIFFDRTGGTIAFNTGGSIFCNLRFFLQLHSANIQSKGAVAKADAGTWWWVTVAHELAHNLVTAHNSEHSFYT